MAPHIAQTPAPPSRRQAAFSLRKHGSHAVRAVSCHDRIVPTELCWVRGRPSASDTRADVWTPIEHPEGPRDSDARTDSRRVIRPRTHIASRSALKKTLKKITRLMEKRSSCASENFHVDFRFSIFLNCVFSASPHCPSPIPLQQNIEFKLFPIRSTVDHSGSAMFTF